jgi:hypothetical protein
MKRSCTTLFIFILISTPTLLGVTPILFDSRYSTIKIAPGGTFWAVNSVPSYTGTLNRQAGGTITGNGVITFLDGIFEDNGPGGSFSFLTANYTNSSSTLTLPGNSFFKALPGTILQAVSISSTNNLLSGSPVFNSTVTLTNASTTVTLALQSDVNTNITLNGGTVYLQNDLNFAGTNFFSGNGTIGCNGYEVGPGDDSNTWTNNISWQNNSNLRVRGPIVNLNGIFTFNGACTIIGHGNSLNLAGGGSIVVASGGSLSIADIEIQGLGPGAGSIVLTDSTSFIFFTDTTVQLNGNVTSSTGNWVFIGPGTVTVQGNTWTFNGNSVLYVENYTLWKDPAGSPTIGNIVFGSPANLTYVNNGIISYVATGDNSTFLQSQINVLGTSTQSLFNLEQSCCSSVQSQLNVLYTSTQSLQSVDNSIAVTN